MTIVYFILILGITITIHEFGHFIAAKKAGVYCYEFAIGMGPKLLKWRRKNDETEYSIRLFPIGGFVTMAGEEVEIDEDIPKEKRMQSKTWGQRFITISAGVILNFILTFVLLVIIGFIIGPNDNKYHIAELQAGMPAEEAGFEVGDTIVSINGKKTRNADMTALLLQMNSGKTLEVGVKRNGESETITVKPQKVEEDGEEVLKYGFSFKMEKTEGFFAPFVYAANKFGSLIDQMAHVIGYLVTGQLSIGALSGPVGIFGIVSESAKAGIINIVYLLAVISLNVGFVNFLPIPAFDGGRLLFLIIEKIKGSPVNQKIENTIHGIALALLMILMLVITVNDVIKLF